MNSVHFSSKTPEWETPQALFDSLNKEFKFNLDPCATKANAKCKRFFTEKENGLNERWHPSRVFMNPPYGRVIGRWVHKAWFEAQGGAVVVCLLPSRTDTKWFHDYILGKAEIRFLKGRLKFGGSENSAPFPSMVVIFKKNKKSK